MCIYITCVIVCVLVFKEGEVDGERKLRHGRGHTSARPDVPQRQDKHLDGSPGGGPGSMLTFFSFTFHRASLTNYFCWHTVLGSPRPLRCHGRGHWKSQRYEPCPCSRAIAATIRGHDWQELMLRTEHRSQISAEASARCPSRLGPDLC